MPEPAKANGLQQSDRYFASNRLDIVPEQLRSSEFPADARAGLKQDGFNCSADYADQRRLKTNQERRKSGSKGPTQIRAGILKKKRNYSDSVIPGFQIRFHPFTTVPPFGCKI